MNLNEKQGEKLNEILKKYKLKELSPLTTSIWFGGDKIYRDITHLNRCDIFNLVDDLKYENLFTKVGVSIFDLNIIFDSQVKKISIQIELLKQYTCK